MAKKENNNIQPIKPDTKLKRFVLETVRTELFQGVMPPPEMIEKYEKLFPGAAKFFFTEVEKQTNHRIEIEKKVVDSNIRNEKRGSWFAFIITMSALIGGFTLTAFGFKIYGVITAVASLFSLVGVFISGKLISVKEIKNKKETIQSEK